MSSLITLVDNVMDSIEEIPEFEENTSFFFTNFYLKGDPNNINFGQDYLLRVNKIRLEELKINIFDKVNEDFFGINEYFSKTDIGAIWAQLEYLPTTDVEMLEFLNHKPIDPALSTNNYSISKIMKTIAKFGKFVNDIKEYEEVSILYYLYNFFGHQSYLDLYHHICLAIEEHKNLEMHLMVTNNGNIFYNFKLLDEKEDFKIMLNSMRAICNIIEGSTFIQFNKFNSIFRIFKNMFHANKRVECFNQLDDNEFYQIIEHKYPQHVDQALMMNFSYTFFKKLLIVYLNNPEMSEHKVVDIYGISIVPNVIEKETATNDNLYILNREKTENFLKSIENLKRRNYRQTKSLNIFLSRNDDNKKISFYFLIVTLGIFLFYLVGSSNMISKSVIILFTTLILIQIWTWTDIESYSYKSIGTTKKAEINYLESIFHTIISIKNLYPNYFCIELKGNQQRGFSITHYNFDE